MTQRLDCSHAEYRSGMVIYCRKTDELCGNVYFCSAKGWWRLNPMADLCPLRKENDHGKEQPSASGGSNQL